MGRNFDQEIEAAETSLHKILLSMEQNQMQFKEATLAFIQNWYEGAAKGYAVQNPDLTKQLGKGKIGEIRAEIKRLQEDASTVVDEILNDDEYWWHKKKAEQQYDYFTNRAPSPLDKAVRLIAGRLGSILQKYGYIRVDPGRNQPYSWREFVPPIPNAPKARPIYPHSLDWPEPMRKLTNAYSTLQREAQRQEASIKRLKEEKETNEAESLWDDA